MLSRFKEHIYRTTTDSLLIYDEKLVMIKSIPIESPSVLHQRFISFNKTLYFIDTEKLNVLFIFNRRIVQIQTYNRRVFLRDANQNIFYTEHSMDNDENDTITKDSFRPLKLVFAHHCSILSFFPYEKFIIFADQHKFVLFNYDGLIERIILENSDRVWFFDDFFIQIYKNEIKIVARPFFLLKNNKFEHSLTIKLKDLNLLEGSLSTAASIKDIKKYRGHILLQTDSNLIICDFQGKICKNLQYSTNELLIENDKIIIKGTNGLQRLDFN